LSLGCRIVPFVPEEKIVEIQRATDIVQLIGEYLPLKKSGSRYWALCPFHDEKTASFSINPATQFFHCFGCHKGGTAFNFIMAQEKVDFPEAVKMLAKRAGIALTFSERDVTAEKEKTELLEANRWAATWFHRNLIETDAGQSVLEYVRKRGISGPMAARFLMGYAPDSWTALLSAARKEGISEARLVQAGLVRPAAEGKDARDWFHGRLMFPIFDVRGSVIGFGARSLDGSEPKYLNTPETWIFSKGRNLYGLNFAKDAAAKIGKLCIMEGYTDVILAHQHGVEWAVASCGTALTEDHVRLIRRYATELLMVYDGDDAGQKASRLNMNMFLSENVELRVATMPAGLDPADCLLQRGKDAFMESVNAAKDLIEYRIAVAKAHHDVKTVNGKAAAIEEMMETLDAMKHAVRHELLIKRISEEFGVTEQALRLRLKERPAKGRPAAGRARAGAVRPDADSETGRDIIELILLRPELLSEIRAAVSLEDFPTEESRKIAAAAFDMHDNFGKVDGTALVALLKEPELGELVVDILEKAADRKDDPRARLKGFMDHLAQKRKKAAQVELMRALKEGEKTEVEWLAELSRLG
jgi:DNA primase